MKPIALYFNILNYTQENLALLESKFKIRKLDNPNLITDYNIRDVEVLFAPLGWKYDVDLFNRCPQLKIICTNTTSIPHINLEDAKAKHISVFSLKDEIEFLKKISPTAELTLALMIIITRNVIPAINSVKRGEFSRWPFGGEKMLSRMSVGIAGFGRLGSIVAKSCFSLGMDVHYYDPKTIAKLDSNFTKHENLESLVNSVDIVSAHMHASSENYHLFDRDLFSHFKKGSYFVNTARGELVDSYALIEALQNGTLIAAGLDVIDNEFDPNFANFVLDHPLVKYSKTHNNLIITPHIGGSTRDAWHLTQRQVIQRAIEYFI